MSREPTVKRTPKYAGPVGVLLGIFGAISITTHSMNRGEIPPEERQRLVAEGAAEGASLKSTECKSAAWQRLDACGWLEMPCKRGVDAFYEGCLSAAQIEVQFCLHKTMGSCSKLAGLPTNGCDMLNKTAKSRCSRWKQDEYRPEL